MLCHIGQAVPLSIGRFGHLLAAGSVNWNREYPSSDSIGKSVNGGIGWANIGVEWSGEISKQEKALFLEKFLDHGLKLRVCWGPESAVESRLIQLQPLPEMLSDNRYACGGGHRSR